MAWFAWLIQYQASCISITDKMIECPTEKFIHTITMMAYYNKSVGSLLCFLGQHSITN